MCSMQCPRSLAGSDRHCSLRSIRSRSMSLLTLSSASLLGLRDFPHAHSCARGEQLPREFPLRATLSSLVLYSEHLRCFGLPSLLTHGAHGFHPGFPFLHHSLKTFPGLEASAWRRLLPLFPSLVGVGVKSFTT